MQQPPERIGIWWVRRDQRLHDNSALRAVLASKPTHLIPVYICSPELTSANAASPNKLRFLHESLHQLDTALRSFGSQLYIAFGECEDILQDIWTQTGAAHVGWQSEPTTSALEKAVHSAAEHDGVLSSAACGFSLYDPSVLSRQFETLPPRSYNNFLKGLKRCGEPSQEYLPPPASLPGPTSHADSSLLHPLPATHVGLRSEHHQRFEEPALPTPLMEAGEASALNHLHAICSDVEWVATFSKPDTSPLCVVRRSDEKTATTSLLSPYLANGNLSPRVAYWAISRAVEGYKGNAKTKPPQSLLAQLLWRDFFHFEARMVGASFTTDQNSQCLQVEWSEAPEEHLQAWEAGCTGVPLVDAAMKQLVATGWMHHIARHVCACFLTRGGLWVDWQQGAAVFGRHLLDHDPAVNAGNWQWLAGCNYFYTYNRIYNFESFGRRQDPQGRFTRAWLPFIKGGAPYALTRAAVDCSADYPARPIVDLKLAKEVNAHRMDLAFVRATESFLIGVPAHAWQELRRERGIHKGTQGNVSIQPRDDTNGLATHNLSQVVSSQSNTRLKSAKPSKENIEGKGGTKKKERKRTKTKSRVQGAWKISANDQ